MIAVAPRPTFEAQRKFEDTARRLWFASTVERLYRVVLTEAERARLVELEVAPLQGHFGRCVRIWQALHGGSDVHALLNVAFATDWLSDTERRWLLREYGESEDPLAGLTVVCPADTLVIRLWPRAAYWNRERIAVDWSKHRTWWDYLWQLADRSRMGLLLEPSDLSSDSRDSQYLSKMKSRLGKAGFPASLLDKIETDGQCHRFALDRGQVRIYSVDCGLLVETR